MKNIKKYILGMATALCLCQSCDVLDIDPTGNYSETTAFNSCLLYTSPSPRDGLLSRMPSSA